MPKIAELREIDGAIWARVPIELGSPIEILSPDEIEAKSNREQRHLAEIDRLRAALSSCESWIDRWTKHVGNCQGGEKCTCGRSAVLYEASTILN